MEKFHLTLLENLDYFTLGGFLHYLLKLVREQGGYEWKILWLT